MRFFLLVVIGCFSFLINAQQNISREVLDEGVYKGVWITTVPRISSVEGHKYLFDLNEALSGTVITNRNTRFNLSNININLADATFFSKMSKDSLFVYNNVDKVKILHKIYSKKGNKIFEVLFSNDKISLLKDLTKVKSKEVIDPVSLEVRKKSKWVIQNKYYYKKGSLAKLKLNKKNVLKLFSADESSKIKKFVKLNNLSYKKEEDVVLILKKYS